MKTRRKVSLILAIILSLAIFFQNIQAIRIVKAAEPDDEEYVDGDYGEDDWYDFDAEASEQASREAAAKASEEAARIEAERQKEAERQAAIEKAAKENEEAQKKAAADAAAQAALEKAK